MFRAQAKLDDLTSELSTDIKVLQARCPSFFPETSEAVANLSPRNAGRFLSVLHKVVAVVAMYRTQDPNSALAHALCLCVQSFVASSFPAITIPESDIIALLEIAELMIADGGDTPGALHQRHGFARYILSRLFDAMYMAHTQNFRERFSFFQYLKAGRAFLEEELVRQSQTPMVAALQAISGMTGTSTFPNFPEDVYKPAGEPIPLEAFCKPAEDAAPETTCTICMETFKQGSVKDDMPVKTECSHLFHRGCLDAWVNESCAVTSNSCPSCRTHLCTARERVNMARFEDLRGWSREDSDGDSQSGTGATGRS